MSNYEEPIWEGEKSPQVSIDSMHAFGISLCSRYAKANELRELLHFAELATDRGVNIYVASAFYDSKSCLCNLELRTNLKPTTDTLEIIFQTAEESIGQFEWDGCVYGKNTFSPEA